MLTFRGFDKSRAYLTGLSAEYIIQQMADYRNGLRSSSEPQMVPPAAMLAIGLNATESEARAAAEYFARLTPRQWIRVIETETVPETSVEGWMYVAVEQGRSEPIGQRIIEMPEDLERTELRDSRSGFIAYVPIGSVDKGRQLVSTGGDGKTPPCGVCHTDIDRIAILESLLHARRKILSNILVKLEGGIEAPTPGFSVVRHRR